MNRSLLSFILLIASTAWVCASDADVFPFEEQMRSLEPEIIQNRSQLKESEEAWSKRVPELSKIVCDEGPARNAILVEIKQCQDCQGHPSIKKIVSGSESCSSLGATAWREIFESTEPRLVHTIARAIRVSKGDDLTRLRALTLSRRETDSQRRKLERTESRYKELKAIKEISSCQERFVQNINLDSQFPPTNNQGELGTCYAHTAAGAAEAALFRNEGKRVNLSTVYGATCSRLPGLKKEGEADIDGGGHAEEVVRGWIKRGHALECDGGQCQFSTAKTQVKIGEILTNSKVPFWPYTKFKQEMQKREVNGATLLVAQMERKSPDSLIPFKAEDYELQTLAHTPTDTHTRECDPLGDDEKQALRLITEQLCQGLPVMTSVQMHDVDISSDGGKTWKARPYDPERHSRHAMIATGVEWEGDKPFLVFRNSWAEGSAETPHASKARLPFSAHCRINRISVLKGPADKKVRPRGEAVLNEDKKPSAASKTHTPLK